MPEAFLWREGYEDRIDWLIGSHLNRTYVLKDCSGAIVAAYSLLRIQFLDQGLFNQLFAIMCFVCLNIKD